MRAGPSRSLTGLSLLAAALLLCGQEIRVTPLPKERIVSRFDPCPQTNAARLAAVRQLFEEAGCAPVEQPVKGARMPNLVCTLPGASDDTILIGAHFDYARRGRGCADNWSGAAMLPSLFESLKSSPRYHTLVFVAFTDEEVHLVGSTQYAGKLKPRDVARHHAMVNIDTVGLTPTKIWASHADPVLGEILVRVANSMKLPLEGVNVEKVGTTDSEPFRQKKIPTITIHSVTQDTLGILHSPRDTREIVRPDDYYDTYRLTTGFLAMLDLKLKPPPPPVPLESLEPIETIPLEGSLGHVQGIDVEGGRLWVSSVDAAARKGYLHLFDRKTGKLLRQVEVQDGPRFHPGGIMLAGDSVWVPVAEYRRNSSTLIERRDKNTLELQASFAVTDHIGCVAATGAVVFGGNWDSLQIYRWELDGTLISKRDNRSGTRFQDLKIVDRRVVGSGLRSSEEGSIDWLDLDTMQAVRGIRAGKTDRGVVYTREGMAIRDAKLYLLPEDAPSRLFVFALPADR